MGAKANPLADQVLSVIWTTSMPLLLSMTDHVQGSHGALFEPRTRGVHFSLMPLLALSPTTPDFYEPKSLAKFGVPSSRVTRYVKDGRDQQPQAHLWWMQVCLSNHCHDARLLCCLLSKSDLYYNLIAWEKCSLPLRPNSDKGSFGPLVSSV